MILSEAPTNANIDNFLTAIHEKADAVIVLMQTVNFNSILFRYFDDQFDVQTPAFTVKRSKEIRTGWISEATLELTPKSAGSPKAIPHFHYNHWKDGAIADHRDIAQLIRLALDFKRPLIHCIAGEGRSGTFATILEAYRRIKAGQTSPNLVKQTLIDLRKDRPGAVHSFYQYWFAYDVLTTLCQEDGLI